MPTKIIWIGIAGTKFAGKDSFARGVQGALATSKPCFVRRRALADALKEEVAEFLAMPLMGSPRCSSNPYLNKAHVLDCVHSDIKEEKERYRLLLQWWGTEFRRHYFGADYWCAALEHWMDDLKGQWWAEVPAVILVPDVRFPNEVAFIRDRGGLLVKIVRPSDAMPDTHASETALDDDTSYDQIILNDSTLFALTNQASRFVRQFVEPRL